MSKQHLTTFDVAKQLQTTVEAIHSKLFRGTFPKEVYFRVGRRVYFNQEKFNNWINSGGGIA